MATKKEFASIYLSMKMDNVEKETAQEELAQNLLTTLRKVKAQLELAETAELISAEQAEVIKSLSDDNTSDEYNKIKRAILSAIKKGLKGKDDVLISTKLENEMQKVFKRGE